jgi:hypothetical protein
MPAKRPIRTHSEIRPVKESIEDRLLALPGVEAVDIREKVTDGKPTGELAIVVSVSRKKPKTQLSKDETIPAEVDGIPTDVVEEKIVLHAASMMLEPAEVQVDAGAYSPLKGGIGMGPCRSVFLSPPDVPTAGNYVFVGTLGAMVKDRSSGAAMALTNFHVGCIDDGWTVGDVMAQPSLVDGGSCPADRFATLTRAVLSEKVDGSVSTLDAGKTWNCEIVEIGSIKGHTNATNGMNVRKRGRTTGLTYGNVTSIDASVSIDYGDGLGTHVLKHQIRVDVDTSKSTQFGDHGDSGSVVVDDTNKVVGLHFAGNTAGTTGFANPIQAVLDELDVDLCQSLTFIVTKPIICDPLLTKPVVCYITTKPSICYIVTKPIICNFVTTPQLCEVLTSPRCPVVTRFCPVVSIACGIGDPGPFERPPVRGGFDPGGWYGSPRSDAVSDAFWEGYYSALDAVSVVEEEEAET